MVSMLHNYTIFSLFPTVSVEVEDITIMVRIAESDTLSCDDSITMNCYAFNIPKVHTLYTTHACLIDTMLTLYRKLLGLY